jgi:CysZ protein
MKKHKLTWYFLFPLLLNILLFILGYVSSTSLSTRWFVYVTDWIDLDSWNFWGSGFLASVLLLFMHIVIRLLFVIFFAYIGGYIIIALMSPVYAFLSEKVESIITGINNPFDTLQFFKDIWRGLRLASRNFIIEIILSLLLLVLSFIPVIGLFTALALFIISSFFYGFSFIDFSLERKKMNMKESVAFIKANKGLAIGNGSVFSLVLLIPFIGVLLSGFVSLVSLVAATLAITETHINQHSA